MSSGSHFSADVSAWVKKAGDQSDAFCRVFCSEMAERVILRTPVDTGFCRSQWQPSINGFVMGDAATVTLAAAQMIAGDTFAMTNNTDYVRRLEYGWSQQAPNGMVRMTLAEAPSIAQQVLAKVMSV
jgi:hypothetical protein